MKDDKEAQDLVNVLSNIQGTEEIVLITHKSEMNYWLTPRWFSNGFQVIVIVADVITFIIMFRGKHHTNRT